MFFSVPLFEISKPHRSKILPQKLIFLTSLFILLRSSVFYIRRLVVVVGPRAVLFLHRCIEKKPTQWYKNQRNFNNLSNPIYDNPSMCFTSSGPGCRFNKYFTYGFFKDVAILKRYRLRNAGQCF